MGKFPNSEIHNQYSDWHYGLIKDNPKYKRLYVADIDRLWLEYDFTKEAIVAVFDIKWKGGADTGFSSTEKGIYDWFILHGCPVYIVFINREFTIFEVHSYENPLEVKTYTSVTYADWLLSLRKGQERYS